MEKQSEMVLWPLGNQPRIESAGNRQNQGLEGARLAFAWDELFKGDRMWAILKEQLHARWPTTTFVEPEEFGNFHDKTSHDVTNTALRQRVQELEIDAAIVGVGA